MLPTSTASSIEQIVGRRRIAAGHRRRRAGRPSRPSDCRLRSSSGSVSPIRSASASAVSFGLVALAAQLLDGDVARRVDLGPRDHPRRPVLVPDPDVLHLQVEERVARLRDDLEVEPVAQVGRVLGEDAVAEQAEDGGVLALQLELELRPRTRRARRDGSWADSSRDEELLPPARGPARRARDRARRAARARTPARAGVGAEPQARLVDREPVDSSRSRSTVRGP